MKQDIINSRIFNEDEDTLKDLGGNGPMKDALDQMKKRLLEETFY